MDGQGRFLIIDGIAGSGKSTVLHAARQLAVERGQRVFDLREWTKTHADPPRFEDVAEHDVYLTCEPTRQWVGAAIRFELSRTDVRYSGESIAHAFALDREIMYRRLVIPALDAKKTVVQDRGVCTSIVYQPIMPNAVALETLMALPGNALALRHSPDHLILTRLDPSIAVERLKGRPEESRGVFADLPFLERVDARFRSEWFSELFRARGTALHVLPTDQPLESMITRARELLDSLL